MKIFIDYYVKRISDKKIMEIKHLTLTEYDILELAKKRSKRPICFDDEKYELTDFIIDEVRELK